MVQILSVLVAAAAFFSPAVLAVNFSSFVSDTQSISFSINIPDGATSDELYFSMSGPSRCTWLAVGMGNNKMENTLVFTSYSDTSGKNITLSPRISGKHSEPVYTKDVKITILPGTGIFDDIATINAKCSNCRKWKGGSIDPKDTAAKFIWANGGIGDLKSNSLSADTKRHGSYGKFKMDLSKAVGPGGALPLAAANSSSAGSQELSEKADHDFSSGAHALIMVFVFVGLMPLAILILRVFNSPKFHGIAQGFSALLGLIGAALGLSIGVKYNRSKKFNSAHQVIGLLVIIMMIGQFVLGFMHHRMYKKTKLPTKLAPIHVWLGRVVIAGGVINGFLGFPLALNSRFNWALLSIALLVVIVSGPLAFWRWRKNIQQQKTADAVATGGTGGYQAQPWRTDGQNDVNLQQMNYPPPPTYGNAYR
ncbi:hypothetical protein HYFRA_00006488 [Hymenoscyphus fraxineus]|uniref:Iron reductase domain protein n=1 Tax=Hymenoscyphus fraxineus TaxID=746836 RepID=A0A9N9KS20_9HELO|nr:hypothetical protein HYFRA_00006488 [Hymenoscyphus fraxineus]